MTLKRIILCAALLLGTFSLSAMTVDGPESVEIFAKAKFDIAGVSCPVNPYTGKVLMLFTAPDGQKGMLPCYYEGGMWHASFAPRQAGEYRVCFEDASSRTLYRTLTVVPGEGKGFLHARDNWTFAYDNGEPFRGIGENICWESRAEDDNPHLAELHQKAEIYNYDVMLPKLAENGGNFTRMWMCQWNFPLDRHSDFNNPRYYRSNDYFNPSVIERMDHVFALAEELGIKIMLCMGQGDVVADSDFFTSPEAKEKYKARLRYIVARWSSSPAIGCWEFFNEIDNIQFADAENPIPAEYIVEWHREMAAYLRSIDPHGHPITTSISHRDLEGLNDIEYIDFNQKHMYRCVPDIPRTIKEYEARHGKPYVIGEAGAEWDWYKNFDEIKDEMDLDFSRAMWYGLFNPTPIAPMSWWWEWFESRGKMELIKPVREMSERMLAEGKGDFRQLEVKVAGNDGYAVKCGAKTFVYIFNPTEKTVKKAVVGGKTMSFAGIKPGTGKIIIR